VALVLKIKGSIVFLEALSEKPVRLKKTDVRISASHVFSESSSLVIKQIFKIFGHSLVDRQGLDRNLCPLRWAFFEKVGFSLKMVPFYHLLFET
jgi:hypothetical protein